MLQRKTWILSLAALALAALAAKGFCAGTISSGAVTPGSATGNSIFNYTVTWTQSDEKYPYWPCGQLMESEVVKTYSDGAKIDDPKTMRLIRPEECDPPKENVLPIQFPLYFKAPHGTWAIEKVSVDCTEGSEDLFDHREGTVEDTPKGVLIHLGKALKEEQQQDRYCVKFRLPGYVAVEQVWTDDGLTFYLGHTPVEKIIGIFPQKDSLINHVGNPDRDNLFDPHTGAVMLDPFLGDSPFPHDSYAWAVYLTGAILLEVDKASSFFRPAEPFVDLNQDEDWDPDEPYTDSNLNGQWDPADSLGAYSEEEGRGKFTMGYVEDNPKTGAKFRVRLSAGLNLANDPAAVPGINYAPGHIGRSDKPYFRTMKRKFEVFAPDGPCGVAAESVKIDWTEGPDVYNSRNLGEGILLERIQPDTTKRVKVPWEASSVRAVYRDGGMGPTGTNYFDSESGAYIDPNDRRYLWLSKELPNLGFVFVLYNPMSSVHRYDPTNNLRYGGPGGGVDSVGLHKFYPDPLVPEFNPPDKNDWLKPYDYDFPDDATANTAFVFRIMYANAANLWPKSWLPWGASPYSYADGNSGVVLYLDARGTGDYVPYFMQRQDPISSERPDT